MDTKLDIKIVTGVKTLDPIEYRVTSYKDGPWWWRQTRYAVESAFMRLDGFDTRREAEAAAAIMRG